MFILSILLFTILIGASLMIARFFMLEFRKDRIPILIYHRIVPDEDFLKCRKASYVVTLGNFTAQMNYLKVNGFVTIDLDDYLHFRQNPKRLPDKPVIITFDDGYENNYHYAYPVLKKYAFKAVIYAVADPHCPFFSSFELPERLLSPRQMKELCENGISIQGHTTTHPYLKYLTDDEIYQELKKCKDTLEHITGKPVIHMAVPYGSMDNRLLRIARDTGYKTVSVPGKGTINLDTDPFAIKRLSIHSTTNLGQFARLLNSPAYIVLQRIYAAGHLFVRRVFGQSFEKKLKVLFARFGLDDAEKLAKVGFFLVALFAIAVFLLRG